MIPGTALENDAERTSEDREREFAISEWANEGTVRKFCSHIHVKVIRGKLGGCQVSCGVFLDPGKC